MARRNASGLKYELFGDDRPTTLGEAIFFKAFELFVVAALGYLAWKWGLYSQQFDELLSPEGVGRYVDLTFLLRDRLLLLNAGLICALLAIGYVRVFRWAYLAALILLHVQYVTRFSLGKLEHGSNLLAMMLLGLSLATLLYEDSRDRRRFALGFGYLFTGLAYVLAGVSKLVGTGILWPRGAHLWLWIQEKAVDSVARTGEATVNTLQEALLASYPLATLALAAGLVLELCAFLVWWRRCRPVVLTSLALMHVGIYMAMGVLFTWSIVLLLLLALPYAGWLDRLLKRGGDAQWVVVLRQLGDRYS